MGYSEEKYLEKYVYTPKSKKKYPIENISNSYKIETK